MKNIRIFVVEDEFITSEYIRKTLANRGYRNVRTLSSGEDTLNAVRESRPDIILMDIMLKGEMDGISTVLAIQKTDDIPVIYTTAHSDETTLKKARETGPYGFLLKPLKVNEICSAIELAMFKFEMQARLKQSESKYREIINSINEVIISIDKRGCVDFISPAITAFTGYSCEEVCGRPYTDIVFPGDVCLVKELMEKRKKGYDPRAEYRLLTKRGSYVWISSSSGAQYDDGEFKGLSGVIENIDSEKKKDDSLKMTRFVMDNTSEEIYWIDCNANFFYVNNMVCHCLGYTKEELLGMSVFDVDPEFSEDNWAAHWAEVKEKGSMIIRSMHQMKNGYVYPVEITLNYQNFEGIELSIAFARDISGKLKYEERIKKKREELEKKNWELTEAYENLEAATEELAQTNEELEAANEELTQTNEEFEATNEELIGTLHELEISKNMYKELFESMVDGYVLYEPLADHSGVTVDYRHKEFNPAFLSTTGLHDDISLRTVKNVIPSDGDYMVELLNRVNDSSSVSVEKYFSDLDKWLSITALKSVTGMPAVFVADLTREKEAEGNFNIFRSVMDYSNDAIYTKDLNGIIRFWNPAAEKLFGYSESEISGRHISVLLPDNRRNETDYIHEKILNGENVEHFFTTRLNRLGHEKEVSITVSPVKDFQGEIAGMSSIAREINMDESYSERERIKGLLNQFNAKLLSSASSSEVMDLCFSYALALSGFDSGILYLKAEREKMYYATKTTGFGEEYAAVTANLAFDTECAGRFESKMPVYGSFNDISENMKEISAREGIRSFALVPIINRDNVVGSYFLASHEVYSLAPPLSTAIETAALQAGSAITRIKAEEKLTASLREKETLLKEIHHRVKNNMQLITSLLELQSQYIEDSSSVARFRECQNRVYSMALVHEKLYQSESLSMIELSDYISELVGELINYYADVLCNIDVRVNADSVYFSIERAVPLGLIINELVTNAVKYAFSGLEKGVIDVVLKKNDDAIEVMVRDDGVGLGDDFDMAGASTLGLMLVRGLVDQLGGRMDFETGKGTLFRIEIAV